MNRKQLRRAICAVAAAAALATALTIWLTRDDSGRDTAVLGQVLVSADGRSITTAVRWAPCQEDKPRLVARESSDSVTLALKEGEADLRHQCASTPKQISTTLKDPLKARHLIDAVTGWTITAFDGTRLAAPRYLPPGYHPTDTVYQDDAGQRPLPSPFERTTALGPAWTRFYHSDAQQPSLSITQISGKSPEEAAGTAVTVNGYPGHLDNDKNSNRAVTWSDGTYTFIIDTTGPQVTNTQLLDIAKQLS
ncbi:hypothetical protein [Streptomyces sp. NPDC050485]|uniref:hypothetical protein n=1 Tax=Streptomyces sp. NPDC050485 TaxID=3365617 RepID=UPI003789FD0F